MPRRIAPIRRRYDAAVTPTPSRTPRLTLTLAAVLLLVIGTGCVSWHPVLTGLSWLLHS